MIQKTNKVWSQLANACDTPAQYIRAVMSLRHEKAATLAIKLQTSETYVRMLTSDSHEAPGMIACYRLAKALDIDPYILNRICQDYKLKKYIEKESNKNHV